MPSWKEMGGMATKKAAPLYESMAWTRKQTVKSTARMTGETVGAAAMAGFGGSEDEDMAGRKGMGG